MTSHTSPILPTAQPLSSNRRTSAFERRIARTLEALGCAGPVVVAASGGADSTATLVAVARALGAGRVTAAHFDHRLRTPVEAARDADLVRDVAERLGVPVVLGRPARRPSDPSEAAAREARYRWLASACVRVGATDVVTGHTLDDQAETVLLQLARGAGALGAAGMRPDGEWPVPARGSGGLRLLRPLLSVTRFEVEAYLEALGIDASVDATNETLDYARNRIRRDVLPALREVNARAGEHLAAFAGSQRDDDEVLTALAREWLEAHAEWGPGLLRIDRRALRSLPVALGSRVVREGARRLGVALEGVHVRAVMGSLGKSGRNVDLPLAHSRTAGSLLELRNQPSTHAGTD